MRTRRLAFLALACGVASASFAQGDAPLSAIDWLSDSVDDNPPQTAPVNAPAATVPNDIRVVPLDKPVADQVGLIEAAALAVPVDLWGQSSARDLARELGYLQFGAETPPAIRAFVVDLLQAQLAPPVDAAVDDQFFLARIDRLLELGHLDAAEKLLRMAGLEDPQRFRRAFDIGLLKGTETETCRMAEETPDLSPTYPARIFCLARLGNFDVAALTLGNAETLGILSDDEDALLLRFLDPELFDEGTLPAQPRLPTPLEYRLFEAVGERIATDQLPVAFAVADLTPTVGWKARLRAAERLAATGALPFEDLLRVFSEREPAASGGIWERVRAVMALADTKRQGDGRAYAEALPTAWAAAREGGYHLALANWAAPSLELLADPGQGRPFGVRDRASDGVERCGAGLRRRIDRGPVPAGFVAESIRSTADGVIPGTRRRARAFGAADKRNLRNTAAREAHRRSRLARADRLGRWSQRQSRHDIACPRGLAARGS